MTTTDDAFLLLTEQHTLLVVDTETCPAADGGPQRVVSIGTVAVTNGRPGRVRHTLFDPGEPITNSHIHGITDAQVASAKVQPFTNHILVLNRMLSGSVVFVAHNAPFDLNVLAGEYERAGATMPDVAVLDTLRLPAQLHVDTGSSRTLGNIAKAFGITHKTSHNAAGDAVTAAKILVKLLRAAAADGWTDLDDLCAHIGGQTTSTPTRAKRNPSPVSTVVNLPDSHIAGHASTELPDSPTVDDIAAWLVVAAECVTLRCPAAQTRAVLANTHAAALLTGLVKLAPHCVEPGQGGTLAAMLDVLALDGLTTRNGLVWWKHQRPILVGLPRCSSDQKCSRCQAGTACALDTLHQSVTRVLCAAVTGPPPTSRLDNLMGNGSNRKVVAWTKSGYTDIAGYAAWITFDAFAAAGADQRADACIDQACQLGLDVPEPRIALERARTLAKQHRFTEAEGVVLACQRNSSTDSGYLDLSNWYTAVFPTLMARTTPLSPRLKTLPRQSRPITRQRPNRYKF